MLLVIAFSLIGGLLSLTLAIVLLKNDKSSNFIAEYATPFAAGVLLAAAFTDLLPEALHDGNKDSLLVATLFGILGFFMLERYLRFFHHHHEHEDKTRTSSPLIIIGDTLHNALDGVAIGAAFLINPATGIVAALAVAAHEIPQEVGDFGLLLKNGMKRKKVIFVNVLSALATTLTALLTFGFGSADSSVVPYLLAITAGFFIYIASSDIIPGIHGSLLKGKKDIKPWLLLLGAGFIMIVSPIAHGYIDAGHDSHGEEQNYTGSEHAEDHEDGEHDEYHTEDHDKNDSDH